MARLRVVIAEDDPAEIEALRRALDAWGHSAVGTVRQARDVVSAMDALHPDVVLLNVIMPQLDGVGTIRQIMARRPVPIVIVAPPSSPDRIDMFALVGAMGYLVKPVKPQSVGPALSLATSQFGELMALRSEILRLKDAISLRQTMQRAKGIMAHRLRLTEPEAHRTLQRFAVAERCSVLEAAGRVTTADKFFTQLEALA